MSETNREQTERTPAERSAGQQEANAALAALFVIFFIAVMFLVMS